MHTQHILTIRDVLQFLNEEVAKDPNVLDYQVGRYEYDEYSMSSPGYTYGCSNLSIDKLPEIIPFEEGVDPDLTSKKILTFQ